MKSKSLKPELSIQAFRRMPYYLQYLRELYNEGTLVTSSPFVSKHFGFTEVQVRKDFAAVSSLKGVPRHGFDVKQLIDDIENILGYKNTDEAVLVGVGAFGHTFLLYDEFEKYGLKIVAAFDINKELIGTTINDKPILHFSKISELCRRMKIHIGIITVPSDKAQIVCDQLIAGGVLAIWNFTPVHLSVPDNILVQNDNAAVSLAVIAKHLQEYL